MLRRLIAGVGRRMAAFGNQPVAASWSGSREPQPAILSQRGMLERLGRIPYWEDKINFAKRYAYQPQRGAWATPDAPAAGPGRLLTGDKVHYGCGGTLLDGWVNVDLHESDDPRYHAVNLLERHPFQDASIRFGFCEDMLEHLTQADSIFFLAEVHRCMTPGGVMRLSFPGLEGVLKRHYTPPTETRVREGELESYAYWDHIHFYAAEELALIGRHLGFRKIEFVDYGTSAHPELCGLDTRDHQKDLNTYAELTK